jgi:hypothetical protein
MNLQTTLNIIGAAKLCANSWQKRCENLPLGLDHSAHISFLHILETNGICDALWALRFVLPEQEKERNTQARLLACDYAQDVMYIFESQYPNDKRPQLCIAEAMRFSNGQATEQELLDARTVVLDARDIQRSTSWDASWAAAGAAAGAGKQDAVNAVHAAWGGASVAMAVVRDGGSDRIIANQKKQFIARFCTQEASK